MDQNQKFSDVIGILPNSDISKEAQWGRIQRWLGERVSDSFKERMETLRRQNEAIQEWTKDINKMASMLNKALKQGKMVEIGYLLNKINDRLIQVGIFGKEVQEMSEEAKQEFESQHDLESLEHQFGKTAQWGRSWLAGKLFGDTFRKERQAALQKIIKLTVKTVDKVNLILKQMNKDVAQGNIGDYSNKLDQIAHIQRSYFDQYRPVYDEYLKKYVDVAASKINGERQKRVEEQKIQQGGGVSPSFLENLTTNYNEKPPVVPPPLPETINPEDFDVELTSNIEVPELEAPVSKPAPYSRKPIPNIPPAKLTEEELEGVFPPQSPAVKEPEDEDPADMWGDDFEGEADSIAAKKMGNHEEFYLYLSKIASQDIYKAVDEVLKYSAAIEDYDLESSLKLLAIAEGFLNNG